MQGEKVNKRAIVVAAAAMFTVALMPAKATAQAFPDKPIQMIIPFAPAGASDVLGRILAKELESRLGQPVVIVNKPGAGTVIGAQALLAAPADGYSVLLSSNSTFALNPAVIGNLPYDSGKDFDALAQVATIALAVVTYADHPAKNIGDMIAAAKAAPDSVTLASFGNATTSHFAGEWLKSVAGIKMTHVAYKGSGPAMNDLVGKHIPFLVDTVVASKPQIDAGRIRALAVTQSKRSAMISDVPTLEETGIKGVDLTSWVALVARKGIPAEAKARLMTALDSVMNDPGVIERIQKAGFEVAYQKYADWPGRITSETAAMKAIADKAGIKAE